MANKVRAIINGVTSLRGEPFELTADFTLIEPGDNNHYGTGCYMLIEFGNGGEAYYDVRYAGTKDIKKLATMYIRNSYGDRLRSYQFV